MDVSLCLVLLQLTVAWSSGNGFRVEQPKYIEAVENEPVTLTCTFTRPEISSLRDIDVRWRVRNYYTAGIFRYLNNHTHKDFRGRIKFLGSPFRDNTGSIRLLRVRELDSNIYFCSVVILGEVYTGPGTVLSVQARTGSREFRVRQLGYQEAAENGSAILPCSFTYPDIYTPRDIHITWRVGGFHGAEIFDSSRNNALGEYRGRIEFLGSPLRDKTGSIRLHRLKGNDSNFYVCRVTILEDHRKPTRWQSMSGTFLSVRARTGSREFRVKQPGYQEAAENGSAILPCSFTYPDTYTPRDIHITWRVSGFHGAEIFDSSRNNAFGEYRGRIEFLGSPLRDKTGSIRLHRLKGNDSNFYVCRVTILEDHRKPTGWQSISGTFLSVRAGSADPRGSPTLLYTLLGVCGLALCVGLVFGIWIIKRKRSGNIKKENHNPVPAVGGDKNVRQCQEDSRRSNPAKGHQT
ncbi:uncharacterized protein LOC134346255 isoform X2 [Mobula hypostoma]|uniref:uncharacterized protein LOC134346255 isoform X2 n=1 Tax=Mobula hypostoma TaxID=723540 RepID=UPI002FC3DFB3